MKSRMTGNYPEALTEAISKANYEVVAHEQGHIQDEMKGGELPAEQRAREVVNLIGNLCDKFYKLVKSAMWAGKPSNEWAKCEHCGKTENPYIESPFYCYECQKKGFRLNNNKDDEVESLSPFKGTDHSNQKFYSAISDFVLRADYSNLRFEVLGGNVKSITNDFSYPLEKKDNLNEYDTVGLAVEILHDLYDPISNQKIETKFANWLKEISKTSWYKKYFFNSNNREIRFKQIPINELEPITAEMVFIYKNL
jgi:YHS domain-containing protein